MSKELINKFSAKIDELHISGCITKEEEALFSEVEHLLKSNEAKKDMLIKNKKEFKHHIEEGKKLLEQGRFTLQDVAEKLSFLTSDLWIVMERLDSISKLQMEDDK